MTCESPIDQGDSRSYSLTVLLGSHRVKGHEGAERLCKGMLGFFTCGSANQQTHGGQNTPGPASLYEDSFTIPTS
jgi:hypothetical protein